MKRKILLMVIVLFFLASVVQVHAGAVLHIGNPPNTGAFLYGSEIRPISNTSLGIKENGNGQPTLVDPALLLILGVPNKTDANITAPSVTLSAGTGNIGGRNVFSGAWNITNGYAGYFQSGEVYDFIGFDTSGNSSKSFDKWHDANLAVNGINATGFWDLRLLTSWHRHSWRKHGGCHIRERA